MAMRESHLDDEQRHALDLFRRLSPEGQELLLALIGILNHLDDENVE